MKTAVMVTGNILFLKEDRDLLLKKQFTFVEAPVTQKALLKLIIYLMFFTGSKLAKILG